MTDKSLSGRAAIAGLGVTEFSKNSGRTELRLAMEATLSALADAGIDPSEVEGFSSYTMDKVPEYEIARLLGCKNVKFFSQIPHGGGGPGVGPVAVRSHLAPYLPSHPLSDEAGPATSYGPVSAAPFGSAGVLPISFAFIAMLGADGLKQSGQSAVLAANYVAARIGEHYPILYTGANGLVAHECIADLRPLTKATGVSVDDVAKRLIDYGFHAPTMSFPVAGTLMIEPTESESKAELDRFCDAMIAIRAEADAVAAGEWPADDNPLHNAPHTQARVVADDWTHPYPRILAAYPGGLRLGSVGTGGTDKYWPASARIDGVFGDRNLVCSCPPVGSYEE